MRRKTTITRIPTRPARTSAKTVPTDDLAEEPTREISPELLAHLLAATREA